MLIKLLRVMQIILILAISLIATQFSRGDELVIEIDNPKFSEKGLNDKVYEIKAKKALKKTQQSGTGGGGTEAPHKPMSLLDEIKAKKALKKTGGPGSGTATGNSATPIQTANTEGLSLMEQIKLKQQAKKKGGIDLSKLP